MMMNGLLARPYGSFAHGSLDAARAAPGNAVAALSPDRLPAQREPDDDPAPAAAPMDAEISFGPFCLRPAERRLLEGDKPVPIGGRGLDLLIALVARAGALVAKDDLVARVWPNVLVCESNLKTQVAVLRRALRDGRDGARYVVSIPGRGYCFVAPIARSLAERSAASTPARLEAPSDLPVGAARAIGRAGFVGELAARLQKGRFVTVVGPCGIGKTTVALAAAMALEASGEFSVCFVDLSEVSTPSRASDAVASALGVATGAGDPTERVIARLGGRRMLIVLDCCDRVVDAAAVLAEKMLKGAPGVRILATSQEAFRAEGETICRLPTLETPPDIKGLTAARALAYPSIQLFVERVASDIEDFALNDADAPVVAEICRRLDGLPLAIELAAGHVHAFGARGVAATLNDGFKLRMRGRRTAQPRHQMLGAALDWSCRSLSNAERLVLRRLSALPGPFTLDAACAAGRDVVASTSDAAAIVDNLVAKSLVHADVKTTPCRYYLLGATRTYLQEKVAYIQEKAAQSDEMNGVARSCAEHVGSRSEPGRCAVN